MYTRAPEHDRRLAHGDDFAADGWRDEATGQVIHVVVGHDPNTARPPVASVPDGTDPNDFSDTEPTDPPRCPSCQGEGRIPAYGTGDQAGGYADTCQECKGTGRHEPDEQPEPWPDAPLPHGWIRMPEGDILDTNGMRVAPDVAAAIQRSEDAVCLVIHELALTDAPALIEFLRAHTDQQRKQLAWRFAAWLKRECEITREPSHILKGWQQLIVGAAASGLQVELANHLGYVEGWDAVAALWRGADACVESYASL